MRLLVSCVAWITHGYFMVTAKLRPSFTIMALVQPQNSNIQISRSSCGKFCVSLISITEQVIDHVNIILPFPWIETIGDPSCTRCCCQAMSALCYLSVYFHRINTKLINQTNIPFSQNLFVHSCLQVLIVQEFSLVLLYWFPGFQKLGPETPNQF